MKGKPESFDVRLYPWRILDEEEVADPGEEAIIRKVLTPCTKFYLILYS